MRRSLLLLAAISGCAESIDLTSVEQETCNQAWCGGNSSKLGGVFTHRFHIAGEVNPEGFKIRRTTLHGEDVRLEVVRNELSVKGLTPEDLVELRLWISHDSGDEFVIDVRSTTLTPYWAQTTKKLRTYFLTWSFVLPDGTVHSEFANVCTDPPTDRIDIREMRGYHAVVFEGDIIDDRWKEIIGEDKYWFNIGCAGHALAKMALTGHTYSPPEDGMTTKSTQRQAYLKMVTGDYCGNGTTFTVPGTALDWKSSKTWLPYTYTRGTLEARWSEDGAICLNTPRLVYGGNPTGGDEFPNGVVEAIEAECGLSRKCETLDRNAMGNEYLVSANLDGG